jgi:glycosyltransferase involved in cell wall biosynthesis
MTDKQPPTDLDILILGPVPPPFGGIAVHISRIAPMLAAQRFRVGVLNHFAATDAPFVVGSLRRSPFRYYELPKRFRAKVLHYHHSRWVHLIAFAAGTRQRKARRMLTLHAGALANHFPELSSQPSPLRHVTYRALRTFDTIVAVDPKIGDILRKRFPTQRIEVLPAFVASVAAETDAYEPSLEKFLSTGSIFIVAAYGVQFLRKTRGPGNELYGLDTAVEAFTAIAPDREDLRLAVFLARVPSRASARRHLAALETQVATAGLQERVRIVYGKPLLPAFRENVVFVRPTRSEGDAVSVREAQRAGVPVVASDVVPRPAGVRTFPVGDAHALARELMDVLDSDRPSVASTYQAAAAASEDPFVRRLLDLYRAEVAAACREASPSPEEDPSGRL